MIWTERKIVTDDEQCIKIHPGEGGEDYFTISFTDIEGITSTIDLSLEEGTELVNQLNGFIRDRQKYKEPAF